VIRASYVVLDSAGAPLIASDDLEALVAALVSKWRRGECLGPISLTERAVNLADNQDSL
jgi:hypothetical protein